MLGMFTVCIGTAFWLLTATWFKLPVSSSHSVGQQPDFHLYTILLLLLFLLMPLLLFVSCQKVASIMGFTIVAKGTGAIDWMEFMKIAVSWVASPVLSGIISVLIYLSVKYAVLVRVLLFFFWLPKSSPCPSPF